MLFWPILQQAHGKLHRLLFLGNVGQGVHGAPVEGGLAHQLGDAAPVHGRAEGGTGSGKEDPGAVQQGLDHAQHGNGQGGGDRTG